MHSDENDDLDKKSIRELLERLFAPAEGMAQFCTPNRRYESMTSLNLISTALDSSDDDETASMLIEFVLRARAAGRSTLEYLEKTFRDA